MVIVICNLSGVSFLELAVRFETTKNVVLYKFYHKQNLFFYLIVLETIIKYTYKERIHKTTNQIHYSLT